MGLHTKDDHYKENNGTGWKIYLKDKEGTVRSLLTRDIVLENEWMLSEDRRGQKVPNSKAYVGVNKHYDKGFHIYEFKPCSSYVTIISMDLQSLIPNDCTLEVRKIEFEDVVTSGEESHYFPVAMGNLTHKVIIANKIKVLPVECEKVSEKSNKLEGVLK